MNRKYLPALLMLTAAAVTCIITYVMQFTIIEKLFSTLLVMVIFGTLGYVLKWTLDYFEKQNEQLAKEEGEVIEKGLEEAEGAETENEAIQNG